MFGVRLVPGIAACAAALVVLAGCGGSDGPAELAALTPVAAVQKAAANAAQESAAYTFELAGNGVDVRGDGAFRGGDDPAARMAFEELTVAGMSMPGDMEFRLVDEVMYLRGADGLLPGVGAGWVKLPVDEFQASGNSFGGFDPMMADPREQLQKMLDTEDVTRVGTSTIDGAETTHYRAQIQPESAGTVTERRSGEQTELERALEDRIRESIGVPSPAQVDVWVDGDFRARKLVLAMPMPMLGELTMTLEFSDFGSDVEVDAPAGATSFDAGDLFGAALGGSLADSLGGAPFDSEAFDTEAFEKQLREQIEGSISDELEELIRSS